MNKFTLLELLVVIAILGILASILLPSLSIAREKGFTAVCTSNMKQCYIQALIYKGDNNNYLHMKKNDPGWFGWTAKLYDNGYIETGDLSVFCPKSDLFESSSDLNDWRYKQNSYGGNIWGLHKSINWNDRTWLIFDGTNYFSNYISVATPSEFIFLGETCNYDTYQNKARRNSAKFTTNNTNVGRIWTIHDSGKRANATYTDGHIKHTLVNKWRALTEPNIPFDFE